MITTTPTALEQIYDRLPQIHCQGKCFESCGPIPLPPAEAREILPITPKAAVTVMDGLPIMFDREKKACPHLVGNRCSIRSRRPLLCRIWGLVKEMRCPHGCKPERWLSQAEAHGLIRQVKELG